jgi:hypothetical protein
MIHPPPRRAATLADDALVAEVASGLEHDRVRIVEYGL